MIMIVIIIDRLLRLILEIILEIIFNSSFFFKL